MLSKEDLLRNVDELYEACLDELYGNYLRAESERVRQKNMNAALREKITEQGKKLEEANAEITERDETITALQGEITRLTEHDESDALKAEITQRDETITALQREITRIKEHDESDALRVQITALNAEIAKKQKLIDAMKAKFSELSEKAVAKIRKLKARILQDAQSIASLRAENETLRNNSANAPALLTPPSEWPREFLFLRSPQIGGIVPTFWNRYISNFPLGPLAGQARRYDLYIGYLYEYRGFNVEYCGINNGVYDDGIDLICRKDNWAILVRCKANGMKSYFVYYLAARALRFKMDNPSLNVGALCVTSSTLSDNAKNVADKFSIAVKDTIPFQNFPYVKCKVLDDGTKVHYTPLDNEYLTTTVSSENGDMFCDTANDAMQQGFNAV